MPLSTTFQQDGGECKGFSFAEFHTVEHAQYFMSTYPGSWLHNYDPNGPQLIIENRAVQLEYARDRDRAPPHHAERERGSGSGSIGGVSHGQADWLCNACSCHNFARRDQCFRCSALRPQNSELVIIGDLASSGNSALSLVASDVPSAYLVVRGFNQLTVRDEHLMELLRQFAVVKSVTMLPAGDPTTNYSTGMAFVEFHTVDHASYTLKCTAENGLTIDGIQLKVSYAKESMMAQIMQHQNHQLFTAAAAAAAAAAATATTSSSGTNSVSASASYAAAALQAAQWSMNNVFAGAIGAPVPIADPYAALLPGTAMLPPGMGMIPVPPVKSKKSKWPPTFESQGGAYVFQAKTGYFLEPATNFYFCPKSKLYFNGSDGIYYRLKQTHTPDSPAVELFEPPLPCETDLSSEATAMKAPSETLSAKTIIKLNPIKLASSTTTTSTPASSSSSSAFSQQESKAETKSAFSMNIAPGAAAPVAGKKVLKDILKWGALQKEEEEEQQLQAEREKEKQANKLKQKKGEIADTHSSSYHSSRGRDDNDSNGHSSAPRAHKESSVEATKPLQPPPPAPVPQIPALPGKLYCYY